MTDEKQSPPLRGIRVLDISSFIAAPAAAVVLADYGADVIKVEPPEGGDPHRTNINISSMPKSEVNYPWHLDSRNKRSLALDLKRAEAREILHAMVERSDVLITNYPFPVRKRLGLAYQDIAGSNPRLIYASFSGYGEEGPEKDNVGFDSTAYFARSGLLDNLRYQGQPPAFSLPAQGDRASAMTFFGAIMLALFQRERTGRGQQVSTSLFANGLWSNGMYAQAALLGAFIDNRPPRERPRSAIANMYKTSDDRWVSIAIVNEDKMWPPLCHVLGMAGLIDDPRFAVTPIRRRNSAELVAIIDPVFAGRTWEHWHGALKGAGIPHSVIGRSGDLLGDEQAKAAKAVVPTAITEMPWTIAAPFQIAEAEQRLPGPAPRLGEHTREVLCELGLAPSRIDDLVAKNVVYAS